MAVSDPLLHAFLVAGDDEAAAQELGQVFDQVITPVVRDVVRARLRSAQDRHQLDDVQQDVLVQLTARLWQLRARQDAEAPIEQFRAYATVVAQRACDGHLRRRFPERTRLRSRVRYVLTHHPACRLDVLPDGQMCGLRDWESAAAHDEGRAKLRQLVASAERVPGLAGLDLARQPLAVWLPAALAWVGAPVDLDDLVSVLIELTGTAEHELVTPDTDDGRPGWDVLPAGEVSHAERVEARSYLRWLWTEIRELPTRQRAALLLNLRDEHGGSVLPLLVLAGIAPGAAVATALEISVSALRALWPTLPLEDARIAEHMGLTRQQVINLRKSARLRLMRRSRQVEHAPVADSGDEQTPPPAIRRGPRTSS